MQTQAWDARTGNRGKHTLLSLAFSFRKMKLDVTIVLCDNGNCFYMTHVSFLSQENLPKITLSYAKIGSPILLLQKEQTAMLCQYKVKGLHVDFNNSLATPLPLLTPHRQQADGFLLKSGKFWLLTAQALWRTDAAIKLTAQLFYFEIKWSTCLKMFSH